MSIDSTLVISILTACGGGAVVAVINAIVNRSKNKADVTSSNIEDALKLKEAAMIQFQTTAEKLEQAQELLDEVKEENRRLWIYIAELENLLDKNNISYEKLHLHSDKSAVEVTD